jgi:hypothetical protein
VLLSQEPSPIIKKAKEIGVNKSYIFFGKICIFFLPLESFSISFQFKKIFVKKGKVNVCKE